MPFKYKSRTTASSVRNGQKRGSHNKIKRKKIIETPTMFSSCDDGSHLSASNGKSDQATASPGGCVPSFTHVQRERRKRASLLRSGTSAQPLSVVRSDTFPPESAQQKEREKKSHVKLELFPHVGNAPFTEVCWKRKRKSVRGSGATRQGAARQLNSRRETRGLPSPPPPPRLSLPLPSCFISLSLFLSDSSSRFRDGPSTDHKMNNRHHL